MIHPNLRISLPPGAVRGLRTIRDQLPPLNFIVLHYLYYIVVCLVAAIIFWGSSTPAQSITFIDSLFFCVSAMTLAGLNTVNLSQINTWQQFMLFFLTLIGSSILISCAVVHIRKTAFEKRFASSIEQEGRRRRALASGVSRPFANSLSRRRTAANRPDGPEVDGVVVRGRAMKPNANDEKLFDGEDNPGNRIRAERTTDVDRDNGRNFNENSAESDQPANGIAQSPAGERQDVLSTVSDSAHIRFAENQHVSHRKHTPLIHMSGVGARQDLWNHPRLAHASMPAISQGRTESLAEGLRSTSTYFESDGFVGRNSQFHSLSLSERERLGGVEYKALVCLEVIVVAYFILWQLIGFIGLGTWIWVNDSAPAVDNDVNPWWASAFLSVSAFNNNGMSLIDANMVAFQSSAYVLLTTGLLILAGNTCYPVFLRVIIWTLYKLLPTTSSLGKWKLSLRFLLDHPRRCYTNLFPSNHTWWLLGSVIALNGTDWVAFEILNIGNESLFPSDDAPRVLDGFFQALAVRSGGFYVVPIANLRVGLLILYVLMMYISAYPVTITIRNSNVYEERSLGIFADDPATMAEEKEAAKSDSFWTRFRQHTSEASRSYFVRQQLRGQLAHDLWWICLAVLFIAIIETQQFGRDPITFSVLNLAFETVSAYGCVGISTGAPGVAYSFSGEWHTLSKLILCAVMLRGRHRGLPVAIDHAVLLPGEHLDAAEEADAVSRRERTIERNAVRRREDVLALSQGALTV